MEKDIMLYFSGSKYSYHCEVCGSNVFRKVNEERMDGGVLYKCNGCSTEYLTYKNSSLDTKEYEDKSNNLS